MDNEITNNTLYEVQVNVLNTELGNKDLTILGEEIEAYDNLAGKCFEEVCKRYWYIKNVVFRDDSKGWREWRDKQGRSKRYINQCIKLYQNHIESKSEKSTSHFGLGYEKNRLLSSMLEENDRDEFVNNPHEINGVEKTVEEMTVKELEKVIEEVKKKHQQELKEEREAKETVIKNNEELQRQLDKEKSTKKVEYRTNEVEVPPDDYDELKYKASQYDEERKKNIELGKKIGEVQNEKTNIRYEYENKMRNIQQKYDEIKKSLEEMDLEEEKLYKYVRQDKELGQFVGDVQVLLLDRLASFNYSAYLDDDVNKYNVDMLAKLINQIRRWCNDMENMIEKYTEEFEEQENKEDENIIEIENVEVE